MMLDIDDSAPMQVRTTAPEHPMVDLLPWLILILPLVIGYFWYVSLVTKRNKALEALSGVDVQLKQRSNLIPNILTIAKRFLEHEQQLLTEVTELRAGADRDYDRNNSEEVRQHLESVSALGSRMAQVMVAVEAYPDLKSDATMLKAQQSYNEIEAKIAAARRFYNASVTALNNAVQIFPGNIIAGWANVTAMPFYEADDAARAPVDAGDFL